jgi:bifunctional non-homologous end joining protein LigD
VNREAHPRYVAPELATLVDSVPEGAQWLHETKFDGYRILGLVEDGKARLLSRNGKDWTARLPGVKEGLEALGVSRALVDGEAAALLPDGRTRFQALQNRLSADEPVELVYFAFDLLHLEGYDLRGAPLEARKALLERLVGRDAGGVVRYSAHVGGQGAAFFRVACERGLEGIVCKRRDAPYRSGRGRDWLKVKCQLEQEVVIGGMTAPAGSRVGLGALLVGVHDEGGRLRYAGKVGTGFTDASLRELEARLREREAPASPFAERVPGASSVTWTRPELVAEVSFTEWTNDGRMRHPSFRGLREDKDPREVVREVPSSAGVAASAGSREATSARTLASSRGSPRGR